MSIVIFSKVQKVFRFVNEQLNLVFKKHLFGSQTIV